MEKPALYIMTNKQNGTLYTGVAFSLLKRVWQHKNDRGSEFVAKYNCKLLVYYCFFDAITDAILMEKKLNKSSRERKLKLIETMNPNWNDLYSDFYHSS